MNKHCALRIIFALAFLAAGHVAFADDNDIPRTFASQESVALSRGASRVELSGRELICSDLFFSEVENDFVSIVIKKTTPTPAQWKEFRRELDTIGVWKWQKKYENLNVMDGMGWSLNASYKDKQIQSRGRNAFPAADGSQQKGDDQSPAYKRLSAAIQKLTGPLPDLDLDDALMFASPIPQVTLRDAACSDSLRFICAKGNEFYQQLSDKPDLEFVYRYDASKPRPKVNYERKSLSLITILTDVLRMEGLDYQVIGPHKLAIIDAASNKEK